MSKSKYDRDRRRESFGYSKRGKLLKRETTGTGPGGLWCLSELVVVVVVVEVSNIIFMRKKVEWRRVPFTLYLES